MERYIGDESMTSELSTFGIIYHLAMSHYLHNSSSPAEEASEIGRLFGDSNSAALVIQGFIERSKQLRRELDSLEGTLSEKDDLEKEDYAEALIIEMVTVSLAANLILKNCQENQSRHVAQELTGLSLDAASHAADLAHGASTFFVLEIKDSLQKVGIDLPWLDTCTNHASELLESSRLNVPNQRVVRPFEFSTSLSDSSENEQQPLLWRIIVPPPSELDNSSTRRAEHLPAEVHVLRRSDGSMQVRLSRFLLPENREIVEVLWMSSESESLGAGKLVAPNSTLTLNSENRSPQAGDQLHIVKRDARNLQLLKVELTLETHRT